MKTIILTCSVLLSVALQAQPRKEIMYVGTYSIRNSKGIYVFEVNRTNGNLKLLQSVPGLESPTFLELHPSGKFLYSVNRQPVRPGEAFGSASAFAINPKTGKLSLINSVSSYGKDPCHITLDKTGQWAFISNYGEGNLVVLPVMEDGSLGAPSDSKKYFGKSANRFRQDQPHIHSAEVSADNRFLYVSDLGTDKVYAYRIDLTKGKIIPLDKNELSFAPGAGPRHFTFHPKGGYAYVAEELTSSVAVLGRDKTNGTLTLLQDTVRSLPAGTKEINTAADIHTDPSGRFLYLSNRGLDVISIFTIQPNGLLELRGQEKTRGKTPRNFLVDAKGRFVWVANQNSDNITVFRIHPREGSLTYNKLQVSVPSPVCLKQLVLK